MVDRRMGAGTVLALLALASPGMAATPEDEALARDLVVCNGKFIGLVMFGTDDHAENESKAAYASWWAASKLAGTDFVNRERDRAAPLVIDWLTAKVGPKPTMEAATATCLPLLKRAMEIVKSKHPDDAD